MSSLQYVHISLVLGRPDLDTTLQMWLRQCWIERMYHLPWLSGNNFPQAVQEAVSCLCCMATLLPHGQCVVLQDPQLFLREAAFQLVSPQQVLMYRNTSAQAQDFAICFHELYEVPLCPFLQPADILLTDRAPIWDISHASQFCIIFKLAEGALCPIIQVINGKHWTLLNPLSSLGVHD